MIYGVISSLWIRRDGKGLTVLTAFVRTAVGSCLIYGVRSDSDDSGVKGILFAVRFGVRIAWTGRKVSLCFPIFFVNAVVRLARFG